MVQQQPNQQQDDDADLAAAIQASQDEANARQAAASSSSSASDSKQESSSEEVSHEMSYHHRTLLQSFCTLLMEESTIDKDLLNEKNTVLWYLTFHVTNWNWIDWTSDDERIIREAEEKAQKEKEEQEERERRIAQALQDGVEPDLDSVDEKKKPAAAAVPVPPTSSEFALQLKHTYGTEFITFILDDCLIHQDPVTHANQCQFYTAPSRRMCWTIIEVLSRDHPENLKVIINWIKKNHGTEKEEQIKQEKEAGTYVKSDEEWEIDPSEFQRSSTGFVGLKNQAATCYQNSLFQQLFHALEFKKELMEMRDPVFDDDETEDGEVKEEQTEEEANGVESKTEEDVKPKSLLARLQTIFYYLTNSQRKFYDPIDFVKSFCGSDGRPFNPREQQDVLEFCNLLFDRLENNLDIAVSPRASDDPASKPVNLMRKYFRGQFQNELLCEEYATNPIHRRFNLEPFYVMSLDINGCKSLSECLDKFVAGDMLDGGYMCEHCGKKRVTKKRCIIHSWPRLVIFHLKRFDFDFELLKTKKLNDEVSFPLEIDLEPYTETGMVKRDQQEKIKAAKEAEAKEAGLTVDELAQLSQLKHDVADCDPNGGVACTKCERPAMKACTDCNASYCEIHEIEAHAAPGPHSSSSSSDPTKMYRLVGVLVHAGHAEGGHYYSYIRSRTNPNEWHEFNDVTISDFNPDQLAQEAFGGTEDAQPNGTNSKPTDGMEVVMSHKRRRKNKGKQADGGATGTGEEWQTGKLEKSRNAYLLWYELIEPEVDEQKSDETESADPTAAVTTAMSQLSITPPTPLAALFATDIATLPRFLQPIHKQILRENQLQMDSEIFFENAYLETMYRIARSNVDSLTKRRTKSTIDDESEEKESNGTTASSTDSGSKYLQNIDEELDTKNLTVQFIQNLTLFVLGTVARVKDNPRIDSWFLLLQHAYSHHVGCCQWLLERFILNPPELNTYLLECPSAETRQAICNLFEVVVKKLIVFEVDEDFSDALHIVLPPMKELTKRQDAQAGLAAALANEMTPSTTSSTSTAAPSSSSTAASSSSKVTQSSSSDSFLSSALVQSANVEAQLAPEGLFKSGAHSTVAVSAKVSVLEGVGKGTERQFKANGIVTLQQLVEITPAQREAIDKAPTGGMSQDQLNGWIKKAQQAIDFILELSGINEQLAQEKRVAEERQRAKRASAGTNFFGPKLIPAFIRTCLQTLDRLVETRAINQHCCPELCKLLVNLAVCNPLLLRLIIEGGTVEKAIEVILSPITTVEQAKAERETEKAAAAEAAAMEEKVDGEEETDAKKEEDEDDFMTDLEDLGYVEVVDLIDVLVRASTTRSGKPNEPVSLINGSALKPETFQALQTAPFIRRVILQISKEKPDPPTHLVQHLVWENLQFTDILINEIFDAIEKRDFFDFYASIKILQQVLLNTHDSLHQYRIELVMPRLLQVATKYQEYYKATELTIQCLIHLVNHVPQCAIWLKSHQDEVKWMEIWLTKNKAMPKVKKDNKSEVTNPTPHQCIYVVKHDKHEGVNAKWEKNWNNQIEEYGVGLGLMENLTDYTRIFKKMMLNVKVRKA